MALFKMRIVSGTLCMHQIEIKIINTADLQLAFKQRADILFFFEEVCGQLIR